MKKAWYHIIAWLALACIGYPQIGFSQDMADDIYAQAKEYDALGNTEKAIDYYSKVLNLDSTYLNAYFNRGSMFAEQKNYESALQDFENFDKRSPNDSEVQYLMSACYYYLGNKAKALTLVNFALSGNPEMFDALKLRGILYADTLKYREAISDLNKALSLKQDPELHSIMGVCYEGLDDNQMAFQHYVTAEELGYVHQLLFNNLGNLYSQQNEPNKALLCFNKAIAIDPNLAVSHYNKGLVLHDLGFTENAIISWGKAKDLGFKSFSDEVQLMLDVH